MTHREEIWNKAEQRLYELYGDYPELRIVSRFLSEKKMLAHFGVAEYFDELAGICRESIETHNEKLVVKNTIASCFSAYLLGATSINSLPTHRYCKNCKRVEWAEEGTCLFDMKSTHKCICGAEMHADGYGLEWELYLPYAKKHKEKKDGIFDNRYHDLFESILSTYFQKSLLGATQACHLLGQVTGFPPGKIHFDDTKVKSQLLSGSFSSLPPKMAVFLREAYTVAQPSNYYELIKLISFAHGTYTWKNNAELLISKGICNIKDIPASRDEVYTSILNALRKQNIFDNGFAFHVTERVHHGYYRKHGMDENTAKMLKQLGFEDWFVDYLSRIHYMAPRALSILELRILLILTWYHTYYPMEYTNLTKEIPDISKQIKII